MTCSGYLPVMEVPHTTAHSQSQASKKTEAEFSDKTPHPPSRFASLLSDFCFQGTDCTRAHHTFEIANKYF